MRFRFTSVAIAMLLALGCQNKGPSDKQLAQKNWNDARATILMGLAQDQYKARDFDKCRETITKAMQMTPTSPQLHTLLAKVDIEQGQLEAAERELEVSRQFGPNDAEPYYLSGVIYQRWQRLPLALEFYRQAGQRAPAELAYLLPQGEMLVALGRTPEALTLLQAKVAYFENSAAIRDAVGQLLVQTGQYATAVDMFRQASILSQDDDAIRMRLALAFYYNKQYRQAAEVLTHLAQKDPYSKQTNTFEVLGECQLQVNDAHSAASSFETASELNALSPRIWQNYGRAALEEGDLRRADYALRRSIGLDGAVSETHLLLGYVRLKQVRLKEALASFQKASSLDPNDTTSLCMIGYTYEKMGQSKTAMRYYAQAKKIKPTDDMASQLMAGIDK